MKNKIYEILVENNEVSSAELIIKYLSENKIVQINSKNNFFKQSIGSVSLKGPGIILKSSGSKNIPKNCFHSLDNLNRSAESSGIWLKDQGFDLANTIIFNTLPLNHISGFMPLWRSKIWNCEYINISPNLIKNTKDLVKKTLLIKQKKINRFLITSLVPTQLYRLLSDKDGIKWLYLFDLIWVGGAKISKTILKKCIKEKINLSPCYGSTETAAMITSLKPVEFLSGHLNDGQILKGVEIRINNRNLIEIKTDRIGIEINNSEETIDFKNKDGWWQSGDIGIKYKKNNNQYLKVYGRIDNTINSGGETIFLDLIKERIENFIIKKNLPITHLELQKKYDDIWGEKYIVFISFEKNIEKNIIIKTIEKLNNFSDTFQKFEKPMEWINNTVNLNNENQKNWKSII